MKKEVRTTRNGVRIAFSGDVKKQNVVAMVENCAAGRCECMSEATKRKIETMQVSGDDGDVELELTGEIGREEIEAALKRSRVLGSS